MAEEESQTKVQEAPKTGTGNKEIIIEPEEQSNKSNRLQFYADKLEDLAGDTTFKNYNKLLLVNTYESESNEGIPVTYKSRMLKPQERGLLRKLINEGANINRQIIKIEANGGVEDNPEYDKLWDNYLNNIRRQGKLLIKDLTDEQFDNSDFYVIENLIVAWRMKYQGFRSL